MTQSIFKNVFLSLIFVLTSSVSSHAASDDMCSRFLTGKPVLDIHVEEKNNKAKVVVFKNETLSGVLLNQLAKLLSSPLKLDELAKVMLELKKNLDPNAPYFPQVAGAFKIQAQVSGEDLSSIPKDKPVIFYANHPLSGADAFAIGAVMQQLRPDLKVVAAPFLAGMPGFRDNAFIVDNRGTPEAKAYNQEIMVKVNEHIANNHALLIFPSGTISAYDVEKKIVSDTLWKKGILRFAEQNPETILKPVLVVGEPSARYLKLRRYVPSISNAYVFRELADQIGSTIDLVLGKNIPLGELNAISDPQKKLDYLRERLYQLGRTTEELP